MDVVWSAVASDEDESLNDDTCLPTGYNLDSLDDKDYADSNDGITANAGVPAPAILEEGLCVLGFDSARQEQVQLSTKMGWFQSGFGADPITVKKIIDLLNNNETPKPIRPSAVLLSFNWSKCDDTEEVLAGRYGQDSQAEL